MDIQLTEELVNSVLPNTLITVDEETPLSARIEPYVKDSVRWLESLVIGDVQLPPDLEEMAIRAVILRAVIQAVPALDLVVTPTGFGVVSADSLVPASKERIERLIATLSQYLDSTIQILQTKCVHCQDWRESARGKWYCSTFYPYLGDASSLTKEGQDLFQVYKTARGLAEQFENTLAEEYLGYDLMIFLKSEYYGISDKYFNLLNLLHEGICRYVARNITSRNSGCPNPHVPWHFAESILRLVRQDKKLNKIWKDSMGKKFEVEPFKNTRKGGYFF